MPRYTKFQSSASAIPAIPAIQGRKARRVVEVALLPGVEFEQAFGWLSVEDVQLIEQDVYGKAEIRKFLLYEKDVRDGGLR